MTTTTREDHVGSGPNSMVDWTDLSGWVSRLDSAQRWQVADALRHAQRADHEQTIVESVRDVLAQEEARREAVAVVFSTSEWDNGYFLESSGLVLYADRSTEDGSTEEIDFGDVDEIFTEEFGVCGPQFGLGVNVRTGEVDTDDYIGNLYDAHGYPFPGRR